MEKVGVLFVCLGNICRSPLAEGIFLNLIQQRGLVNRFEVDSCGTGGWHSGDTADPRSIAIARRHGLELQHRARPFNPRRDPGRFPWIIAMDRSNVRNLIAAGATVEQVRLVRSFDPTMTGKLDRELEVPDPYEWEDEGFEVVYQMLATACAGLVEVLVDELES